MLDVTLVSIITREHEDAKAVIYNCLQKVSFKHVLIFTDKQELFWDEFETIKVTPRDYKEWCVWRLTRFPKYVSLIPTEHILNIEPDARIVRPKAWRNGFLSYDYIGAKWDAGDVGNGGFTLISKKFLKALSDCKINPTIEECYPCDFTMCRKLRRYMESKGCRYAPAEIADLFANETGNYLGGFGVHGKNIMIKIALLSSDYWKIEGSNYTIEPTFLAMSKDCKKNPEGLFKEYNLCGVIITTSRQRMYSFKGQSSVPSNCYQIEAVKEPLASYF